MNEEMKSASGDFLKNVYADAKDKSKVITRGCTVHLGPSWRRSTGQTTSYMVRTRG